MAATIQDIDAKLDAAVSALSNTTSSYKQMVAKYGSDWTKWPATTNWYIALSNIAAAKTEVNQLSVSQLAADFSYKEV
jgi:hypothetical protein